MKTVAWDRIFAALEKWRAAWLAEHTGGEDPAVTTIAEHYHEDPWAVLASTIISHDEIHYKNMKGIDQLAQEKGVRGKLALIAGGTQVVPALAVQSGMDAGFGRGTHGIDVATFLVKWRQARRKQ